MVPPSVVYSPKLAANSTSLARTESKPDSRNGTELPHEESLVHGLTAAEVSTLTAKCIEAKSRAYCPYSVFRVGCALLTVPTFDDPSTVIVGANVENAAYPVGICAERVALSTAIVCGYKKGAIKAVAVSTDLATPCSPCGMCRQFLREFLAPKTPIFMVTRDGEYEVKTMGELLPLSFGPEALPPREVLIQGREANGRGCDGVD